MTTPDLVGRLQVRWQGRADEARSPALRLRVQRQLGNADLRPPGLPPGAILVIRHLDARAGLPPSGQVSSAWQGQLRDRIAGHYRRAARPLDGPPAAAAGSVLFADEAELLACLAADVLAGRAWDRWYWQRLWPGLPRDPGAALADAWAGRAAFLPAALAQLPAAQARAAVACLDHRQLSRVVHALHAAHRLPGLVLQPLPPPPAGASSAGSPEQGPPALAAPWHPWLPGPPDSALSPQAGYLLGLSLALAAAPAYARSLAFARACAGWLSWALAAPAAQPAPATQPALPAVNVSPVGGPATAPAQPGPASPHPAPPALPGTAASSRAPGPAGPAGDALASGPASPHPAPLAHPVGLPAAALGQLQPEIHARPVAEPAGAGAVPVAEGVATGLGGLLYLVNWLVRLGLPGGWTDPPLAEHVGGWAILEALGRALLGPAQAGYAADPLWPALQALDGRPPGQAIGHALPPPEAFRLPPAVLRRHGAADALWLAAARAGRLRLATFAGGYLVADLPLAARAPAAVVDAELAACAAAGVPARWQFAELPPLPLLDPATAAALSPALAWWLQRAMGIVRFLAARALAVGPEESVAGLLPLLCLPGHLVVSRTHVDLFISLDRIDLAARRAGLDQDPGWVPDLGRIVQFHFT